MLFNRAGELMLIRNTYGREDLFVLPGGGVRPFEAPESAARREVREELGCEAEDLTKVSTFTSQGEGKRDTIHLYRAVARGTARPDGRELAEARFFPLGDLPSATSPATQRRIAEYLGKRKPDAVW